MSIDLDNFLNRTRFKEGRCDTLLYSQDDTSRGGDADCCRAQLDGFEGVFDLEEAAFGREGAVL